MAYFQRTGKELHLRGLVGAVDGSELIESEITGPSEEGEALGNKLAQELLSRGADKILQQVYAENTTKDSAPNN